MRQIDAPQPPRRANDWLSGTDDEALLRACETPNEKIVVSLLRFSGLRIGEARTLKNRQTLGFSVPFLYSFGENSKGELYVVSGAGPVYKLVDN